MNKKQLLKVLVILFFVIFLLTFHQRLLDISPEDLRTFIYLTGWFAPLFYILLFILRPLILFPASVFSIVGGLAFGAFWGSLLAWSGATAGAVLAFYLARHLGEDTFKHLKNQKVQKLKSEFENQGFYYILLLRLLPIVNFDLISYGAGLSRARFVDFLKATMIGIIPGTLIYNFLGASLVEGNHLTMAIVTLIYVTVVLIPILWRKNIMDHIEKKTSKQSTEG